MSSSQNLHDLDTPCLIVDSSSLEENIRRITTLSEQLGVSLRPHTKTHKSPRIAEMQVESGSSGITVSKVSEAEVMARNGLQDIFIANEIIGRTKINRLAKLSAGRVNLSIGIDSLKGINQLQQALTSTEQQIDVLLEVDTGLQRCGHSDPDKLVRLADEVEICSSIQLQGLFTHEGHVYQQNSVEQIKSISHQAGEQMVSIANRLRKVGHDIQTVSVGSTVSAPYTPAVDGITEMRPGTYVFNDVNQICLGSATVEDCSLTVLSTVTSKPKKDQAVLDAGSKSLFLEKPSSCFNLEYYGYGLILDYPRARITSLSEEHGVVDLTQSPEEPEIGDKVQILPNHVCPVVNLYDRFYFLRNDTMTNQVEISGRGKVT